MQHKKEKGVIVKQSKTGRAAENTHAPKRGLVQREAFSACCAALGVPSVVLQTRITGRLGTHPATSRCNTEKSNALHIAVRQLLLSPLQYVAAQIGRGAKANDAEQRLV